MAFSPSFTISQSALTPDNITATDDSTGSDAAISARRIYFRTTEGEYLVADGTSTDYEVWAYADTSDTWEILDTDMALEITVLWVNSAGTTLYTSTEVFCLAENNKQFLYTLVQAQALSPGILQDNDYFANMAKYWMNIQGAIQAVEIGADISASQNCLDRATEMMNNETKYF